MRAMVGPLNFIRLNLREHFRPQGATTLPETDLFCCVMEIDVGRQGNIIVSRLSLRKRRYGLVWGKADRR